MASSLESIKVRLSVSAPNEDVFETGKYEVTTKTVKTSDDPKPPAELFIVAPLTKGTFPVLLFCHGFQLPNTWYSTLLRHIASHGYIVVAPRFYRGLTCMTISEEVNKASKVIEWLSTVPTGVLPDNVICDMTNVALSGHSRGGKTAFALALGLEEQGLINNHKCKSSSILAKIFVSLLLSFCRRRRKSSSSSSSSSSLLLPDDTPSRQTLTTTTMLSNNFNFKAVIGIDPVAGMRPSNRPDPKILQYIPRSFDMSVPVAVIGTGYGDQGVGLIPPFAPDGVNHSEFFNESKPPAAYFLAKEYGHCDMLDEWIASKLSFLAKSGKGARGPMRKSVGGIVVAFLKAYTGGSEEDDDLNAIVDDPKIAPILLDPVIYVKS